MSVLNIRDERCRLEIVEFSYNILDNTVEAGSPAGVEREREERYRRMLIHHKNW